MKEKAVEFVSYFPLQRIGARVSLFRLVRGAGP